ncbi:hypothetical protein FA743_19865 [Paracoccus gahaiensis]|uniref:Uncharacterized protein n=1 Tax=Paracoccus gahaiensis TaxID=1706839 RepID=A0A4U0R1X4_9RHOB|nr:hypothetical protein [Paracoccus gahaiensis]TJZ88745.1 hypothetical protein FA743_19865 [Paracoccus gahaiensis]
MENFLMPAKRLLTDAHGATLHGSRGNGEPDRSGQCGPDASAKPISTKATRDARTPKLNTATAATASPEAASANCESPVYSYATMQTVTPAGKRPAPEKESGILEWLIQALRFGM